MATMSKPLLSWENTSKLLRELSDVSKLEALISKQMDAIIREQHPDDYAEYLEKNEESIAQVRNELLKKYTFELRKEAYHHL